MVSAFGETDQPTTQGADPVKTANTMSHFVRHNHLDSIDVDYEDLDAMNRGDGAAEDWVVKFTQTLRKSLPQGQFILSHAPLAPWLAPNAQFAAGAYVTINKKVGDVIDFVGAVRIQLMTSTHHLSSITYSSTTRGSILTATA